MERQYCKRCSKCRERTIVIAPISYSTPMCHDGQEYTITIPNLTVPKCSKCGSFAFDHEACCQIDDAFRKQIGLLSPDEIRLQREALGFTPPQLAAKLHIDVATLERWEAGFQIQPRSLDLLMRGFFKSPEFWRSLENNLNVSSGADTGIAQRAMTHPDRPTSETPHEIARG